MPHFSGCAPSQTSLIMFMMVMWSAAYNSLSFKSFIVIRHNFEVKIRLQFMKRKSTAYLLTSGMIAHDYGTIQSQQAGRWWSDNYYEHNRHYFFWWDMSRRRPICDDHVHSVAIQHFFKIAHAMLNRSSNLWRYPLYDLYTFEDGLAGFQNIQNYTGASVLVLFDSLSKRIGPHFEKKIRA